MVEIMTASDIDPAVRSTWQVPSFDTPLWLGRKHPWCVVIPVINEGDRIRNLIAKMAEAKISDIADIIIVDGGSTDGSLELQALQDKGVSGLLVKTGPGKLSSQLRCAYAFALDQGYEGIVSIDGNDKDDPVAIPRFIDALKQGVDFVQASRFLPGGVAVNTPKSRDLAIRLIHAPALSFSSGFPWTDTTQGFRAYSRKMLLDPEISPFRDAFREYELLAYLSHRVPQMGYRCLELSTSRIYPEGEVPTKISAVRGNLKVLKTLLFSCMGAYNVPGTERKLLPSSWPIALVCFIGFLFSVLAFFPGWMSPDSFAHYVDASKDVYNDWQPVMMGWWWHQLSHIYSGPALLLIQSLIFYWGAWGLIALASRRRMGRFAYLIPLIGFWPGLLFPLGQIWKDIAFACSMFFAWAILINAYAQSRRLQFIERFGVFALGVFAFGVKTNGLVALPFLFGFWVCVEGWKKSNWAMQVGLMLVITLGAVTAAHFAVPQDRIVKTSPFQYTQTYDLLAISVKTDQNLLPSYINARIGGTPDSLKKMYWAGGNNALYYNTAGNLTTTNAGELAELKNLWVGAVTKYPREYLAHRLDNFLVLLRWGEATPAYVAIPTIDENPYGLKFEKNKFSDWLALQPDRHPWMFLPWIYTVLLLASTGVLACLKWRRGMVLSLSGSAVAFVAPHFFIAPSADYRYLYYAYFCALILAFFAFWEVLRTVASTVTDRKA